MNGKHTNEMRDKVERGMIDKMADPSPSLMDQMREISAVEYVLKIPRSMDPKVAEMINLRHKQFVEEEIRHFTQALRYAEDSSAERGAASRRSRTD
ncbi:MAG: hypothetical protein SA339_11685 [Methanomassiliicoccus sp.]|nr:hypothetical protein [Methanomassiliicoccus sp.]